MDSHQSLSHQSIPHTPKPGHTQKNVYEPVQPDERIHEMDIVRGVALFGILLANMAFFSSPVIYMQMAGVDWWTTPWDQIAEWFIQFFAEAKFFTMFSFLFGLGFAIFIQRAEKKGDKAVSLYLRRMFILLVIGLIHALLIWAGDILVMYALLGFLLLFFRRSQPKKVLRWAFGLLIVPLLLFCLLLAGALAAEPVLTDEQLTVYHGLIEQSLTAYGEGTYAQIFEQRWNDFILMFQNFFVTGPQVLAMFLFGLYVGKRGMFAHLPEHTPFIRKVCFWSLILGLPLVILQVVSSQLMGPDISVYDITYYAGTTLGGPAFCFFYITSILLLSRKQTWRKLFSSLQAVGRTALSNYLFQSIVCTTVFYSYGLGWYGQIGPAVWVLLAGIIFAIQIVLSNIWLQRFRFGPLEWVWRTLTYGSKPMMRRQ